MISANLIISTASYTNEDAISKTINYICRLNNENIFFYGNWPPTKESAIKLFEDLRYYYKHFPEKTAAQKVQHFWISFENCFDITTINTIANQIAFLFAPAFPICFALHNDTDHIHVHFILSTTSALPDCHPLVGDYWKNFVQYLQNYVKEYLNINLITKYKDHDTSKNPDTVMRR